MWQEARKQEKKLRGIMIDYKRRAERRKAFYAKMKMDPNQLLRIHGTKCKFHIAAESTKGCTDGQLMPWQGDPEVMIDRFDVRANLDFISSDSVPAADENVANPKDEKFLRKCAYERYRTLVQIDATGASEEQYLKQLNLEELGMGRSEIEQKKRQDNDKSASKANAKIHYKYDDDNNNERNGSDNDEDSDSSSSDSEGELSDIDINVNVLDLSEDQTNHLDALATQYGIGYGQYCKQLLLEKKEFEYVKKLEEEEEERAKMPGRKGKSARRSLRAKQKTLRGSPLSFALLEGSPKGGDDDDDDGDDNDQKSASSSTESERSKSPEDNKVEFITEFGADDSDKEKVGIVIPPDAKGKSTAKEAVDSSKKSSKKTRSKSKSRSRSRSRSRSKDNSSHRERKRPRDRSRSRDGKTCSRHSKKGCRKCYSNRSSRSKHEQGHSHKSRSRSPKHRSSHKSPSRSHKRSHSPSNHSSTKYRKSKSRSPKHRHHRSRSPTTKSQRHRSRSRSRSHKEKSRSKSPRDRTISEKKKHRSRSKSFENNHRKSSHEARDEKRRQSKSPSRSSSSERDLKNKTISKESSSNTLHTNIVKRLGTQTASPPVVDKSALTPREKMKLRMQKLLNKQIKSDKKIEHQKKVLKDQETEERDNDIYERSKMMKQKYRDAKDSRSQSPQGRILHSFDASTFRYTGKE